MQDNPWKTLGIAPTTDAAAIYEAYNRKIGRLKLHDPAERYSILMHAQTQALAHAYQGPDADAQSTAPTAFVSEEAEPRVLLRTAGEPPAEVTSAAKVYSEWPEDQPVSAPDTDIIQPAATDWSVLLDRAKLGFGFVAFAIFLIVTAVDWLKERSGDETYRYAEQLEDYEPFKPGPLRDRADTVVAELFGPEFDWERAAETDVVMSRSILRHLESSEDDTLEGDALERARSNLRVAMMFSRDRASRADLIAINRVYLGWLETARSQPGDACREVTGRAFFDGVPQMDEAALVAERALAGRLFTEGALDFNEGEIKPPVIPASILTKASRRSGMSEQELIAAMRQITEPGNCDATIAVLETVLEQPESAPLQLLVRL